MVRCFYLLFSLTLADRKFRNDDFKNLVKLSTRAMVNEFGPEICSKRIDLKFLIVSAPLGVTILKKIKKYNYLHNQSNN